MNKVIKYFFINVKLKKKNTLLFLHCSKINKFELCNKLSLNLSYLLKKKSIQ